jgi:hypothetical protein
VRRTSSTTSRTFDSPTIRAEATSSPQNGRLQAPGTVAVMAAIVIAAASTAVANDVRPSRWLSATGLTHVNVQQRPQHSLKRERRE